MNQFENFRLSESPLKGTHLIEASAGTGKTYAIAGLFLRLVLDMNLSVNEILVVTFTKAATEELKDRIRMKLREAISLFSGGKSKDAFLSELAKRHNDQRRAVRALKEALRAFDQAAIYTIHGFCRKVLYENAFETGSLFDTELISDEENLRREIVDDFWRRHFYNGSPLFVKYAMQKRFSPKTLLSGLKGVAARPYLKVIPRVEPPDSSFQEEEYEGLFKKVCRSWKENGAEVMEIFTTYEGLNGKIYGKKKIPPLIQGMEDLVFSEGRTPVLFPGFDCFTSGKLKGSVKKDYEPPKHPFFELCEELQKKQGELQEVFDQRLLGLQVSLFHSLQEELAWRKEERNVRSFEDLLMSLYSALEKEGGNALAKILRHKFKAALLDEFQDTDPIQHAIFRTIFAEEQGSLFLIGDPKQAIYSFRGADIFAYMNAAQHVDSRYTLGENWRSEPDLVKATNAVFENVKCPFVFDAIPFKPVLPAGIKEKQVLRIDGKHEQPFQLWFAHAGKITGTEKPVTKTQARRLIPRAIAGEISRLVSLGRDKRALLGERPLEEGDIAVLVRTNAEARLIQDALSALRIPNVLYSTGNLFDSSEALEVERVLLGISEPLNDRLVKAAVVTNILGMKGEDLDVLMRDERGWEAHLLRFRSYHDLWNKHGFIRMFRYFLFKENVLLRLMLLPDGERRSTNTLHLSEVLHEASIQKKLGMTGLLKWLSEQRDAESRETEEHQLRLETDEKAVQIVTIHKSKGLEYPVVFCPFAWHGSRIKKSNTPFMFHDDAGTGSLTLDLGSSDIDKNRILAEQELLSENLRLLYVSLTRAKSRCYVVWGRFNEAESSALAYLLHQPDLQEGKGLLYGTMNQFKDLGDEEVRVELEVVLRRALGTIRLSEMPLDAYGKSSPPFREEGGLACRTFRGKIDRQWAVSSFSSLISGQIHFAEQADHDEIPGSIVTNQDELRGSTVREEHPDIFSFPKGAKSGTFIHNLLEHLDFVEKDRKPMEELVEKKLVEYGFEPTWQKSLCDMIQKTLCTPLDPQRIDFTLSRIPGKDRLNELEFYFPLKEISPKTLKGIFSRYGDSGISPDIPEHTEKLQFMPVRGFMKGFIDMVFTFEGRYYLVDWKSNFLGSQIEYYGQERLQKTMEEEFYFLQYHLYTVALDQYLHRRIPGYSYEIHFGGVYYIFLRGLNPQLGSQFGIYRDRPSERLIKELSKTLIGRKDEVSS